jgi:hypothetical protein
MLLVAFSLLISAATAYAECSWVAWLSSTHKTGLTSTTPIGASDSKADCEQRVASVQRSVEATMSEQNLIAVSVVCLPDTVDPRVPRR